jgi:hypothetical protein
MNKNVYLQGIMVLAKIFPALKIDAELYWEFLNDIPDDAFKSAINKITKEVRELFPNTNIVALIREYAEGNKDDKALLAWTITLKAVKHLTHTQTPDFADPVISHCVKQLGGWIWLCTSNESDLPFIQKRFMDYYRVYAKQGIDKPVILFGTIALDNNEKGFVNDIPEPIKIGYETRQKQLATPKA